MINTIYQLESPRRFSLKFRDMPIDSDKLIVRPTHLSICKADQRYYTGERDKEVLDQRLPMALVHEATGVVMYDPQKRFKPGQRVLMVPNVPLEKDEYVSENYLRSSRFCASNTDGFMQEMVSINHDRVVPYDNIAPEVAAITELVSVAMHAINSFDKLSIGRKGTIGVWGDGNFGYITSLLLKRKYQDSKVIVFGKKMHKLEYFSFVDEIVLTHDQSKKVSVNHAFECVGGEASSSAINQMIDIITPEGTIMLLGVSETNVAINTRMLLEKGLRMVGRSRSGVDDFKSVVEFLEKHPDIQTQLMKIVRDVIPVSKVSDITNAFEQDLILPFKTVMEWNL